MASDVTKAVTIIESLIGHHTAHLSSAEQYEAFRMVSRACERMSDELLKEAADAIKGSQPTVEGK